MSSVVSTSVVLAHGGPKRFLPTNLPPQPQGGLPPGVTLQAIDGETLPTSTTQTNSYFATNGYTTATSLTYSAGNGQWYAGLSWDDLNFFPFGCYYGMDQAPSVTAFFDLGFNLTISVQGSINPTTVLAGNGIYSLPGGQGSNAGTYTGHTSGTTLTFESQIGGTGNGGGMAAGDVIWANDGTNSLAAGTTFNSLSSGSSTNGTGVLSAGASPGNLSSTTIYDPNGSPEIAHGTWTTGLHCDEGNIIGYFGGLPNSFYANGWLDVTGTWNAINDGSQGDPGPVVNFNDALAAGHWLTPNGTMGSVGTFSCDIYWFASSGVSGFLSAQAAIILNNGTTCTTDQCARGSHYGNMIDVMRSWGNGTNSAGFAGVSGTSYAASRIPFFGIIESADGLVGAGSRDITAPELQWGVWSMLIHGALGLDYFDTVGSFGISSSAVYIQGKATNTLVRNVARILKSPGTKAGSGFVTAVSPHGYIFPTYETNWLNGGIECCAKWYNGSTFTNSAGTFTAGWYIFATTRYGEAANPINQSATFTVKSGSSVKVIYSTDGDQGNTISISGGTFSSTFTNCWSVKIYKVS